MSLSVKELNSLSYNELSNMIYSVIDDILTNDFNIDLSIYKDRYSIKHSTISYCLSKVYYSLFMLDDSISPYCHNTVVDYNNINMLSMLANIFIDICKTYNKSLGLVAFGSMIGADAATVSSWISEEGRKLNPARAKVIHNVQEGHKAQHISLMNDSGLGLLAVANNDVETGLNWQEKQQKAAQQSTIFLLPSERLERMRIETERNKSIEGNEV